MKTSTISAGILAALAVTLYMVEVDRPIASASEARLVRVWAAGEEKPGALKIDPSPLHIDKNTIVLWMNGVRGGEIQVVFESGKACRDVTANPNTKRPAFFLDAKSCYVTSYMGHGETSALEFAEAGTFEYIVQTGEGGVQAKGKIVVRGD